jgi:hypothetical protein
MVEPDLQVLASRGRPLNCAPTIELRVDLDGDHPAIAVMDALVQAAPGESRASITRRVLAEWADREIRRASLIVRVAGHHGSSTDPIRNRGG